MKSSLVLRLSIASLFCMSGFLSWKLRRASENRYAILMYHRVVSQNDVENGLQAGMYVQPKTFENHIRFLKKYFSLVPISEIDSIIEEKSCNSHAKPICVITFDDGWHDFYISAYPILKAHKVPTTVFLPTNFIGTNDWFWTDRVGYFFSKRGNSTGLQKQNRVSGNAVVNQLEKLTGSQESRLEKAIEILKGYRDDEINEILLELSERWDLDQNPSGRAFLNWKEVREIARSGLITFGSHTVAHKILTTLTDQEIRHELIESRKRLIAEQAVDPSFISFCYPNGNYNDKIAGMVKETGYNLAVTTKKGWNNPEADPFILRRIGIHQDMTSTDAMLGCRITSIF